MPPHMRNAYILYRVKMAILRQLMVYMSLSVEKIACLHLVNKVKLNYYIIIIHSIENCLQIVCFDT